MKGLRGSLTRLNGSLTLIASHYRRHCPPTPVSACVRAPNGKVLVYEDGGLRMGDVRGCLFGTPKGICVNRFVIRAAQPISGSRSSQRPLVAAALFLAEVRQTQGNSVSGQRYRGNSGAQVPPPKGTFPWALVGFLDCMGARMEAYPDVQSPTIPFLWEQSCVFLPFLGVWSQPQPTCSVLAWDQRASGPTVQQTSLQHFAGPWPQLRVTHVT